MNLSTSRTTQLNSVQEAPQSLVLEGAFFSKMDCLDNRYSDRYDVRTKKPMSTITDYRNFTALYNDHKDQIYNFFYYRLSHNDAVAEDLTSDVFLKAYEKFDAYDETYAFTTWIHTIARNTLIDYYRKSDREVPSLFEEDVEDDDSGTFVELIDEQIDIERVQAVLEGLPETQRKSIQMRYFEYREVKEIAAEDDVQEAAVRQNISRGLRKMRELLAAFVIMLCI